MEPTRGFWAEFVAGVDLYCGPNLGIEPGCSPAGGSVLSFVFVSMVGARGFLEPPAQPSARAFLVRYIACLRSGSLRMVGRHPLRTALPMAGDSKESAGRRNHGARNHESLAGTLGGHAGCVAFLVNRPLMLRRSHVDTLAEMWLKVC